MIEVSESKGGLIERDGNFFLMRQFLEHGIPRLNECINLFRHDYTKPNILQLINAASEITDDTLVEIVLSGV